MRALSAILLAFVGLCVLHDVDARRGGDNGGRDFYKILGVSKDAGRSQIKSAYRKLSLKWHPDKNPGDPEAAKKKFQDVAAAYECLSDDEKRSAYDEGGEEALKQHEQGGGGSRDPFDMFSMFGFGGQRRQGKQKTADVSIPLVVELRELYIGKVTEFEYMRAVLCSKADECSINMQDCQGPGVKVTTMQLGPGFVQQIQQADSRCVAQGKGWKKNCRHCPNGQKEMETKRLLVDVEKGMDAGDQITFDEVADEAIGHTAGNLIFTIETLPHKKFKRQGNDLWYDLTISLTEALVGFKTHVKHLDGHRVEIAKTAVTIPGEVISIAKEGMPVKDQYDVFGNMFVSVTVAFPGSLDASQKAQVEKLFGKPKVREEL